MNWDVVIGLEVHSQLTTQSKIFSHSPTRFGQPPNTQASPVDLALPGTLPVLNRAAVEKAIAFGLSIGAKVAPLSVFARKNYFYPDLPKGYQISQFELPVVVGGQLDITLEQKGQEPISKTIRLTRAHLEEDAGKSLHEDFHGYTGIDLNRAGTPLLEIVSEPDMSSAQEAVAYAKALHNLVTWIGLCDGNMQEGSFRVDANVSVKPRGSDTLGTRCEIKNLNSFKFLEEAINFEVRRQIELIEDGGKVVQETRLYDPDERETRSMRSKEDAQDYRYFPDPDLPPLMIDQAWIDAVRQALPELPLAMKNRFMTQYGLSAYDAGILTSQRALAEYFISAMDHQDKGLAKPITNWIIGEVSAQLNRDNITIEQAPVSPSTLAQLVKRIQDGAISGKSAKILFVKLWQTRADASQLDDLIESEGLRQDNDAGALEQTIASVLQAQAKLVEEYLGGKEKAFNALIGQVMKASQGKANPAQANELLKAQLDKLKSIQ